MLTPRLGHRRRKPVTKKDRDALGSTMLPDDFDTPTEALNGLMNGFPDLAYGAGVLSQEFLQQPKKETSLPDGFVLSGSLGEFGDPSGGMGSLESLLKDASVSNLDWLEVDPEEEVRMPQTPQSIPELENAWGKARTNGVTLVRDPDAVRTEQWLKQTEAPVSLAEIQDVANSAYRRVASGESYDKVAQDIAQKMGHKAAHLKAAMQALRTEEGLLGRVYIKAANYPNCHTGRWQVPKSAAYVVKKKACNDCVLAQNGSCAAFKKQIVASVPWDKAKNHYLPLLKASGRQVDNKIPAKESLRLAFRQPVKGMVRIGDARPTSLAPAQQITPEKAATEIQNASIPVSAKVALETPEKRMARIDAKVLSIQKAVLNGLRGNRLVTAVQKSFSKEDRGLAAALLHPFFMKHKAFEEAKASDYSGVVNDQRQASMSASDAWARLRRLEPPSPVDISQRAVVKAQQRKMAQKQAVIAALDRWVQEGSISLSLRDSMLGVKADPSMAGTAARTALRCTLDSWVAEGMLSAGDRDAVLGSGKSAQNALNDAIALLHGKKSTSISVDAAWELLDQIQPPDPVSLAWREEARQRQRLEHTIQRWMRDQMLSAEAGARLLQAKAPPKAVLRIAAQMIGRAKMGAYTGNPNHNQRLPDIPVDTAWRLLAAAESEGDAAKARIKSALEARHQADLQQRIASVAATIQRGLRGRSVETLLRRAFRPAEMDAAMAALQPLLSGAMAEHHKDPNQYSDVLYSTYVPEKTVAKINPREIKRLLWWLRIQMGKGMQGAQLDRALQQKGSPAMLSQIEGEIKALREKYEGRLFVDAAIYATPQGIAGCREGALENKNRPAVKTVLAMPRCGTCTSRSKTLDGKLMCMVYKRKIIQSVAEVEVSPHAVRTEQSVAEYDASEFGLDYSIYEALK